jgi:chaperonin cofactor prefoldin
MDEQLTQLATTAERLAVAAEALEKALARLEAQQDSIHSQVERIVATIDEASARAAQAPAPAMPELQQLQERTAALERENAELKAQVGRAVRKTLPPLVSALLTKSCGLNDPGGAARLDAATLDKALGSLSLEQRIAVKAEMARAGMIE